MNSQSYSPRVLHPIKPLFSPSGMQIEVPYTDSSIKSMDSFPSAVEVLLSIGEMGSVESSDSGYNSVEIDFCGDLFQNPTEDIGFTLDDHKISIDHELLAQTPDVPIELPDLVEHECEDEAPRADSGHGSINTSDHSGHSALLQQRDALNCKRSRKTTGPYDLNDHDRARPTPACFQCRRTFSSRASLRRHQSSATACPGRRSQSRTNRHVNEVASKNQRPVTPTAEESTIRQGRQEASSAIIELPSIHSRISSPLNSDSIPHRTCAKVVTAESERIPVESPSEFESTIVKLLESYDPKDNAHLSHRSTERFTERVEPTTSDAPKCPATSTKRSSLAHEDQTEQPGYIKEWVDSTCVIQSPPSGYSGEEMTCSDSDFGVAYESFPAMSESEEDRIDTDSESFVLTEYSANSPDWDPTGAILAPMKLEYIDRLLSSFSLVQPQWQSSVASDMAGSDRSTGSSKGKRRASSPPSSNSSESRPPKKTKRQSTNGDDENDQGDDDDGNTPHKTQPNIAEDGQGTCLTFACPFAKRYPHRYHKCYSYTLKDVARVKYHLFRDKVHRLPIYCPTCSERFSLEDIRDEHVRASNCAMKPQVKWEGITAKQREQLNKRSPSTNSAVENWNAVYRILFPGDPVPASPYIDMSLSGELRAFREHALSTGPLIWDDILRTRLPETLRSSLEELQSFHRSFYSEAITRLFETWNTSRSTTRSLQSPSSLSLIREGTDHLAPPINTAAEDGSSSPSGSDSALGKSVTNGSQSETEPSPASQDEVALPAQTQQQQQEQQIILQRDPQAIFVPQQLQTAPSFPHMQNTNAPLGAQYPIGFTGYGFTQNPYELAQDPQYALGTTQSGPAMNQFQYQPPSVEIPQGAFHQPPSAEFPQGAFYPAHQMQIQPQNPYNIHTPNPHALNYMGWAPPEANLQGDVA